VADRIFGRNIPDIDETASAQAFSSDDWRGLAHHAGLLSRHRPPGAARDPAPLTDEPGTGAAGGLGFACRWLGARRVAGAEFFLDLLDFDTAAADCTAVVTGEGRIDGQTLAGKLPAVVAARAAPRPVYAVVEQSLLTEHERRRLGSPEVFALADMDDADPSRDPALSRRLLQEAGALVGHRRAGRR